MEAKSTVSNESKARRSILILAYHFPPSAAIGGQRSANFVRNLRSFEWDPAVITINEQYLENSDPDRLAGLADIPIIRTRILTTLRDLYLAAKRAALSLLGRRPTNSPLPAARPGPNKETLGPRLKRYLVSLLLTLPDTETGWILPAVSRALRERAARKSAAILTSGPPHSAHLAGLLVKKLTGTVWVADFRDPWATAGRKVFPTCALSDAIEARLEAMVMRSADLVLTTVEQLAGVYRARYPDLPADRFLCIPNAVTEIAPRGKPASRYERFTLSYTGSLYFGRTPEPVFLAVRRLIGQGSIEPDEIRIRLVGQCRYLDDRPIASVIAEHGLSSVVEVSDTVPQDEAREIIARSDLALLLAPEQPLQIPAKLYEYLGLSTPVLAIAGPGATLDMVAATGCGKAFTPPDVDGIAEFILERYRTRDRFNAPDRDLLARFGSERLTGLLVSRLDRIAGARQVLITDAGTLKRDN